MSVSYIKTITEITIINNNNIKTIIKKKKGKKPRFFPSLHMQNDVSEVLLPYSIQLQHSEDNDTFRVGGKALLACIVCIYICEQVLFVRFTIIPPRLTDQCNFITVL